MHQFNKVELFVFCEPGRSGEEHDRLLAIEEELVQALGLPYRVVNVAAGDLGDPAAKKYDIEAWFPSQQRYREITSTSNTTDFQARRLGIRYRPDEKRLETPHTLNGTAVTDRWLLAILENFARRRPGAAAPLRRACTRRELSSPQTALVATRAKVTAVFSQSGCRGTFVRAQRADSTRRACAGRVEDTRLLSRNPPQTSGGPSFSLRDGRVVWVRCQLSEVSLWRRVSCSLPKVLSTIDTVEEFEQALDGAVERRL